MTRARWMPLALAFGLAAVAAGRAISNWHMVWLVEIRR